MKPIKILLAIAIISTVSNADSLSSLFGSLKHHYKMQIDSLSLKNANMAEDLVRSQLYPKINLYGSATHYSLPNALRPITPSETASRKKQHLPSLFSKDINRIGVNLSMPVFVKSIYTLANSAKYMQYSAMVKKRLDLIKDEATLLGSVANLTYLEQMKNTLTQKKYTLRSTLKVVGSMVKSGRAAVAQKIKVEDGINKLNIAINNIMIQKANIKSLIQSLTGVNLKHSVRIRKIGRINHGSMLALKPLRFRAKSDYLKMESEKEKRLPSLFLKANYTKSYGEGYISKKSVDSDFSSISINFKMPILDASLQKSTEISILHYLKSNIEILKTKNELEAQAKALKMQLGLLRGNMRFGKKDIMQQKRLLKIAKSTFESQRMPIEEYLRYIDSLYEAKADYYKIKAVYWQTFAKLAFIYGNDLSKILK